MLPNLKANDSSLWLAECLMAGNIKLLNHVAGNPWCGVKALPFESSLDHVADVLAARTTNVIDRKLGVNDLNDGVTQWPVEWSLALLCHVEG
jgi:hypothetical protein